MRWPSAQAGKTTTELWWINCYALVDTLWHCPAHTPGQSATRRAPDWRGRQRRHLPLCQGACSPWRLFRHTPFQTQIERLPDLQVPRAQHAAAIGIPIQTSVAQISRCLCFIFRNYPSQFMAASPYNVQLIPFFCTYNSCHFNSPCPASARAVSACFSPAC